MHFGPSLTRKWRFGGLKRQAFEKKVSKAMFTQQQNTVVSPAFESLIQLRLHTARLFTGVTTACTVCNRIHTCQFSGLTTAFMESPRCVNRTGLSRPTARESRSSAQTRVYVCCHVWLQ